MVTAHLFILQIHCIDKRNSRNAYRSRFQKLHDTGCPETEDTGKCQAPYTSTWMLRVRSEASFVPHPNRHNTPILLIFPRTDVAGTTRSRAFITLSYLYCHSSKVTLSTYPIELIYVARHTYYLDRLAIIQLV